MAFRFRIRAAADPQTLPRIVDRFAQRGLTPTSVSARRSGALIELSIEQPSIDEAQACHLSAQLAASILIMDVQVEPC